MVRWKAGVEFLLSVVELLFLSLTVEALQAEADLGMFSMFGRTGAPQKGGPTRGPANFITKYSVNVG